jgi:hypothetical protein
MVKKPARTIIAAIARAAVRWNDHRFDRRARLMDAVATRMDYPLPWIEQAFDSIFSRLTEESLEAVIADELGCLDVLDGFVERRRGIRARALPLGRICIISSRTTVGVAILPAVFALCAKCDVLVKDREDHFVSAFFQTLCEELPELHGTACAETWYGNDDNHDLNAFDGVVAFGSDATLARIAKGLEFSTRFIPYGSKASAGYVSRESLTNAATAGAIARHAARDLLLFETEGCLSLHVLFVERRGTIAPAEFAQMLSDEIRFAERALGGSSLNVGRMSRVAAARDRALFRSDDPGTVLSNENSTYLLVLDPAPDEPPFFLPRALSIRSVDRPLEAATYLQRHGISLEALAVAGSAADVATLAEMTGAAQITSFGRMQDPALGAFHGGRPRIAEFVRWLIDERMDAQT